MHVVFDTNIWISGLLLPNGKAGHVLSAWQNNQFTVATSPELLDEIKKVLLYPKIQKRIQWNENQVNQYILLLKFFTEVVLINKTQLTVSSERDLSDNVILKTLIASHANYLVTGDDDLLILKEHYPIITLSEFCNFLY